MSIFSPAPVTVSAFSDLCCVESKLEDGSLHLQLNVFENKKYRSLSCQQVRRMAITFLWNNQLSKCVAKKKRHRISYVGIGLLYTCGLI